MTLSIRPFIPLSPDDFLYGAYGDWIVLILLCAMFIAVSGAVLPKRLTESRYGRALVVAVGLVLGVGLFKAKEILHFNFESLGFMAVWLVALMAAFVLHGACRIGMPKDIAAAMTFCLAYLSFRMLSPTVFDAIAEGFPLVNLFLLVSFLYLGFKLLGRVFKFGKSIQSASRNMENLARHDDRQPAIEREVKEEKRERHELDHGLRHLAWRETATVKDMVRLLRDMERELRANQRLGAKAAKHLSDSLHRMAGRMRELKAMLETMKDRLADYAAKDAGHLDEIRKRHGQAKDRRERARLDHELRLESLKLDAFRFLGAEHGRMMSALAQVERSLSDAVARLSEHNTPQALANMVQAGRSLESVENELERAGKYEKRIAELDKRQQNEMQKEKKGR